MTIDKVELKREVDLDFVRGVAILLAMGWHFNARTTSNLPFDILLAPGRSFGWAGVDLFFVLSGFLIGRLILKEVQATGKFDFSHFMGRRIFKLWPSLYLFLIAMIIVGGRDISTFLPQIALHVQNFFVPSLGHHLWSLAVEEHFYLIVASLIAVAAKNFNPQRLVVAIFTLLPCILAARIFGHILGATSSELQVQTQYRVDALAVGCLLAVASLYYHAQFEAALRRKGVWLMLLLVSLVWLSAVPRVSGLGSTVGFSVSYLFGASFFMLIYKAGFEAKLSWLFKPLAFLGVYSYAMYIWHVPVGYLIERVSDKFGLPVAICVASQYICSTAVAVAFTRLVERPSLWLRDRVMPSRYSAI